MNLKFKVCANEAWESRVFQALSKLVPTIRRNVSKRFFHPLPDWNGFWSTSTLQELKYTLVLGQPLLLLHRIKKRRAHLLRVSPHRCRSFRLDSR